MKPTLDQWAREQDTTPWYRFSTPGAGGSDPGDLTEAIGDADAIKSTAAGLKNLQRVAKLLLPATTAKPGEPYEDLAELYGRMLGQWTLEMNHVAAIVGGFDTQEKHTGQSGVIFAPVSKDRQKQAVMFLIENAFVTPAWAIDSETFRRIEAVGVVARIRNAQTSVLSNLLNSARFNRLVEQEALDGKAGYLPAEFLADIRAGIWKGIGRSRKSASIRTGAICNAGLSGSGERWPGEHEHRAQSACRAAAGAHGALCRQRRMKSRSYRAERVPWTLLLMRPSSKSGGSGKPVRTWKAHAIRSLKS